tara:strand:- start:309 stop:689 length:381 start_codon:yes stop_codon:yes gene_type:complete
MAATATPPDRFIFQAWKEADVTATGSPDVFNGPCTVHALDIFNANGSATDVFLKVYDSAGATYATKPLLAFEIRAGTKRRIYFGDGLYFSTGLTLRCTDAPMNHASADGSDPSPDMSVTVIATRST